ncbi:MAG TPA: hypothetical protein VIY67_02820 [Nitrospiraceae bacterium]
MDTKWKCLVAVHNAGEISPEDRLMASGESQLVLGPSHPEIAGR